MHRKPVTSVKEPQLTLDLAPHSDADALSESPTETELRQKISRGSVKSALWAFFSEYCNNSSIHGVKYLGERRRPWAERVWWGVVFLLSIYSCFSFIGSSWRRWHQSPVIVTFADKSTPVWQIPFPAVTICPETKVKMEYLNYTKAFNQLRSMHSPLYEGEPDNLTATEQHRLESIYQLCNFNVISSVDFGPPEVNDTFADTLREMSPESKDIFLVCMWRNFVSGCGSFAPILTEEGFCYTFNALNASEIYRPVALHPGYEYPLVDEESFRWSLEDGYTSAAPLETHPQRVLGSGVRGGLFVWLQSAVKDFDYMCRGATQGFKLLLHTPGEIPMVSKHYMRIPLNQEITVTVKPSMFTTSDGLMGYNPSRRQCFFNHERELEFFRVYTQSNCELECLSNYTKERCGCVKFSMPRHADTPICGSAMIQCYRQAEYELLQLEIQEDLSKISNRTCNCLPACTSIVYDSEISQTEADVEKLFNAYEIPADEFSGFQMSTLTIFFKDTQFITSRRSELYGLTNFIANCGGLLGLFMGVSLLSLFEIIYFCSIRLVNNIRMRRRSKKAASHVVVQKPLKALV
ncbi:pickpocket protein 28-like [Phlebotomus argentipes]|uniref:pickpocket protein 28-like n=1 Tax=Phlebotomus argentipes TaxID=94469 RepID=UPI0028934587|nr:pickpocket protein 28-like [Phlebotomus argentipes]